MTGSRAAALPSVPRNASRRVGLWAGQPGHGSFFSNGPLLALRATLGMFLILAAIFA